MVVPKRVVLEWLRGGEKREHSVRILGRKRKEVQKFLVQFQPFPLIFSKSSFFPLLSLVLRDRSTIINSTQFSKDDLHQSMYFSPIIPPRERLKLRIEEPGLWSSLR